jgi:hypothetical protein
MCVLPALPLVPQDVVLGQVGVNQMDLVVQPAHGLNRLTVSLHAKE